MLYKPNGLFILKSKDNGVNMEKIIEILKTKLTEEELFSIAKLLVSCYEPFAFKQKAWMTLESVFPEKCSMSLKELQKSYIPNEIYNAVIFKYYKGESIVKYNLALENINKDDEVAIFELNINSSRLDFSRINGESYAFEIKTELDTTDRLDKQISDYEKVFENIYVVAHQVHLKKVKKIVPRKCGIITYEICEGICSFYEERAASLNKSITKDAQISAFNSEDYAFILKNNGVKKLPKYKDDRERMVRSLFSKEEFKDVFKTAMKNKNKNRWNYVKNNIDTILPIDIQNFFTYMPKPEIMYYKSSSIDLI